MLNGVLENRKLQLTTKNNDPFKTADSKTPNTFNLLDFDPAKKPNAQSNIADKNTAQIYIGLPHVKNKTEAITKIRFLYSVLLSHIVIKTVIGKKAYIKIKSVYSNFYDSLNLPICFMIPQMTRFRKRRYSILA